MPTAARSDWMSCPSSGQKELARLYRSKVMSRQARFRDQRLGLRRIVWVALGQRWVITEQRRRDRTRAEGVVAGGDHLGDALLVDGVLHRHAQGVVVERRDRLVERQELDVQERPVISCRFSSPSMSGASLKSIWLATSIEPVCSSESRTVSSAIVRQTTRSSAGRPPQ